MAPQNEKEGTEVVTPDQVPMEEDATPQADETAVESSNDDEKTPKAQGGSYWDAPVERKLDGKTLSTMDMASMVHQHEEDAEKERAEDATQQQNSSSGRKSYWEWTEGLQRSLSKLRLTDMISQNTDNSEPAEPQNFLQRNSSGSALKDSSTEDETASSSSSDQNSTSNGQRGSYWFWRNASLKNLSNASLTSLENAAKATDKQEGKAEAAKPNYWFWRNASMRNMSGENLDAMEKTARESDRMAGKEAAPTGPLTNLQHRMRNSWRKSFQRMSSNSLTQLSESDLGAVIDEDVTVTETKTGTALSVPQEHEEDEGEEGALSF